MSALMSILAVMTLPPLDRPLGDRLVERSGPCGRLVDGNLLDPNRVAAGHELADLPAGGVDERGVTDEPAEARPVRDENDRLIPGHVDRPHGVAVVEDVGGMPARDAAALPRPLPLVRLEAHAHPVRVSVHLPRMAEEEVH